MQQPSRSITLAVLAAGLASLIAYAAPPAGDPPDPVASADLLPPPAQRMLARTARPASLPIGAAAPPTVEDVGDVDSFGRAVNWLGVAQMDVLLSDSCPPPDGSGTACAALNAAPAATAFELEDVARITLPGRAANSLLCHWLSPILQIDYANPTATAAIARLRYQPTLTVESDVLDDPALIDPTTGLPFGGRLVTGMTASEQFEVPLDAGQWLGERTRDTATCIAGFISKRALVGTYGLTEAQARQFFRKPITVRMNISGQAQYVAGASMNFGLRIVGD